MKKSKRFLFIALAVTLVLSACVKTGQDSSSGDNISSQTGDISSSQIDEISPSQSENDTSSSGASSQTEYAPAISETYENTTTFPLCRRRQKRFMRKMRIYLGTCSHRPQRLYFPANMSGYWMPMANMYIISRKVIWADT